MGLMVPPSLLMVAHCQTNPSTSHGSHTPKKRKWQSLRAAVLLFGGDPTMDTAPFGFNSFQDENQSFSLPSLLLVRCNPPKIPTAFFPASRCCAEGRANISKYCFPYSGETSLARDSKARRPSSCPTGTQGLM